MGVALEQHTTKPRFQLAHAFAHGGRRHAQQARGGGKTLALRRGQKSRQQAMHVGSQRHG